MKKVKNNKIPLYVLIFNEEDDKVRTPRELLISF